MGCCLGTQTEQGGGKATSAKVSMVKPEFEELSASRPERGGTEPHVDTKQEGNATTKSDAVPSTFAVPGAVESGDASEQAEHGAVEIDPHKVFMLSAYTDAFEMKLPKKGQASIWEGQQLENSLAQPRMDLFISSTFRDTQVERDILQREVMPKVRILSAQKRVTVNCVDLRFGIPRTMNDVAVHICLQTISRCFSCGPGPAFVFLSTDRYGWVPPISSWMPLDALRAGPATQKLYVEDQSYDPPRAVLRNDVNDDAVVEACRKELINFAKTHGEEACGLDQVLILSVTALEVMLAALLSAYSQSPLDQSCIIERRFGSADNLQNVIDGLEGRSKENFVKQVRDAWDSDSQGDIKQLLDLVDVSEANHFRGSVIESASAFERFQREGVRSYLFDWISNGIDQMSTLKAGVNKGEETLAHNAFMYEKARMCIDVSTNRSAREEIDSFLRSTVSGVCLVHAQSGAGKSSFLSKLASEYQSEEVAVVTRFCGTTPLSATSKDVLLSVIEELSGGDASLQDAGTLNEVRDRLFSLLIGRGGKRTIIVIDAVDQLKDGSSPFWLVPSQDWLFPAGVHIISSFIPEITQTKHIESYFSRMQTEGVSSGQGLKKLVKIALPTVDSQQDKVDILRHHLLHHEFPRRADGINLPDHTTPLQLSLIVHHSVFHVQMKEVQLEKASVRDLVRLFFKKLEAFHGEVFTKRAFQYLNISTEGLAAIEWEDLLSLDKEVKISLFPQDHVVPPRIPGYVIQHLVRSLDGLFQTSGREGHILYRWFHRQFSEVAKEEYQADAQTLRTYTSYFSSEDAPKFGVEQEMEIGNKYNWRRAVELFPACFSLYVDHQSMEALENWASSLQDLFLVCHFKVWSEVVRLLSSLKDLKALREKGGKKRAVYDIHRLLLSSGNGMEKRSTLSSMCSWIVSNEALPASSTVLNDEVRKYRKDLVLGGTFRSEWTSSLMVFQHDEPVLCCTFSPFKEKGRVLLATCGREKVCRVWNAVSGECAFVLQHDAAVSYAEFSPRGDIIATCDSNRMHIWDLTSGDRTYTSPEYEIGSLCAFSPNGALLAAASAASEGSSSEGNVYVHDTQTNERIFTLTGHTANVWKMAFSPDGTFLVTAGGRNMSGIDTTCRIWDIETRSCRFVLEGHTDFIYDIEVSPDGDMFASACADRTCRLWNAKTGACIFVLDGHLKAVTSCAFSPNSDKLVTSSEDRYCRVWSLRSGECIAVLDYHYRSVCRCVFSPDGSLIATSSGWGEGYEDHHCCLWDAVTHEHISVLEGHTSYFHDCAFSPCGQYFASACEDGSCRIWGTAEATTQKTTPPAPQKLYSDGITSCTFSPDGRLLASSLKDCTVRVWDASTGDCTAVLKAHEKGVQFCVFSPVRSDLLASCSSDCTCRVWDVSERKCTQILKGHEKEVRHCAFSPNGALIATASDDNTCRVWDSSTGNCNHVLTGHTERVVSCQFSAFDKRGWMLATSSSDNTCRVFNLSNIKEGGNHVVDSICTYCAPHAVSFSPDGMHIAYLPAEKRCAVRNLSTGVFVNQWDAGHAVMNVLFSPLYNRNGQDSDGNSLVLTFDYECITVWRVTTGKSVPQFKLEGDISNQCVLSPKGDMIASAYRNTCYTWDMHTGECTSKWTENTDTVAALAFAPLSTSNTMLAVASIYDTMRLLDVDTRTAEWKKEGNSFTPISNAQAVRELWEAENRKKQESILPPIQPSTVPATGLPPIGGSATIGGPATGLTPIGGPVPDPFA